MARTWGVTEACENQEIGIWPVVQARRRHVKIRKRRYDPYLERDRGM